MENQNAPTPVNDHIIDAVTYKSAAIIALLDLDLAVPNLFPPFLLTNSNVKDGEGGRNKIV